MAEQQPALCCTPAEPGPAPLQVCGCWLLQGCRSSGGAADGSKPKKADQEEDTDGSWHVCRPQQSQLLGCGWEGQARRRHLLPLRRSAAAVVKAAHPCPSRYSARKWVACAALQTALQLVSWGCDLLHVPPTVGRARYWPQLAARAGRDRPLITPARSPVVGCPPPPPLAAACRHAGRCAPAAGLGRRSSRHGSWQPAHAGPRQGAAGVPRPQAPQAHPQTDQGGNPSWRLTAPCLRNPCSTAGALMCMVWPASHQ